MGFALNSYDSCIANCTINGKQCTIAWYVDDNKISHVDPDVVTSIIEKIEERFDKMTVTMFGKNCLNSPYNCATSVLLCVNMSVGLCTF